MHRSHTLIVVPPALRDGWERTLDEFKLDNYTIVNNGSLHKIKNPALYDLVIVDEAHKFRSDTASMYNELQKLCKTQCRHSDGSVHDKKVILVSATPLNNKPEDIANLVYLFQDSKDSTLEEGNLQRFFREQIDQYKKLKQQNDIADISQQIKVIYEKIRTKVVEPLTVRRTRTDLMGNDAYRKDLEEQGVHFPNVNKKANLRSLRYEFPDSKIPGSSKIPYKCIKEMHFLILENSFYLFKEGIFFFVSKEICSHNYCLVVTIKFLTSTSSFSAICINISRDG